MALQQLFIRRRQERRLLVGHLWVFSNEVDTTRSPLKQFSAGDLVTVCRYDGKPIGTAYINPAALICARIVDQRSIAALDEQWFHRRLTRALSLRQQLFTTKEYRLVHAEGDFLPGLVIDRYGDHFVVQINTQGMEVAKEALLSTLEELFQPASILLRNDGGSRQLENLTRENVWAKGGAENIEICENNTRFQVPVIDGQKTGWFYDHRENRYRAQQLAKDKTVLDVFSYLGGWGVQAATAGAKSVTCIDASAMAVEQTQQNAALNGVGDRVEGLCDDAFDALKSLKDAGKTYDLVILDPPAFIKRKKDKEAGEQAYQRLNNLAVELLNSEGILVSASCSHHLEESTLQRILLRAARRKGRDAQILTRGDQALDHPVHPAIPETRYIKTFFARMG